MAGIQRCGSRQVVGTGWVIQPLGLYRGWCDDSAWGQGCCGVYWCGRDGLAGVGCACLVVVGDSEGVVILSLPLVGPSHY